MCGIAGIFDRERRPDREALERMLAALEHRGPDGSGTFLEGHVALGNRRLAIIDLSPAGRQPMHFADRYVVTYNGEIYNYPELRRELERLGSSFSSGSDTEVLLGAYAHWGPECLSRLNGMFAFSIYDRVDQNIFCARDRLGVKPFNYTWKGGRFAFASEPKALVTAGLARPDMSHAAMYEYIARGYVSPTRSVFEDIIPLPPGHALYLGRTGEPRVWRWWSPSVEPREELTAEDAAESVATLIDDAVGLRLRSDVPVGTQLSGGLDSSAITASAARRRGSEIMTFTGAFPEDKRADERRFSRSVNEMYGLPGRELEIEMGGLGAVFDRVAWHLDEPGAGPGVFPQLELCDLAARHRVKVVLGGQGGDELFGGYLRHRALHHTVLVRQGRPSQRVHAAAALLRLAVRHVRRVRQTASRVSDDQLAPSFLECVDHDFREWARRSTLRPGRASELMLWDLENYLPALLLVDDRTSMAASVESRTPLLDYRLVEYVLAVPADHKFGPEAPKPLLRRAASQWLPKAVASRREKLGFPTPLHRWKEHPELRSLVHRLTRPTDNLECAVFDARYLARPGRLTASELWTVLAVQGWLRTFQSRCLPRLSPPPARFRAADTRLVRPRSLAH
jgi:asparagine synthase (glutamine-hydrolysing)